MTARVVFLGPSARREEMAAVVDADFQPPVSQGDVFRAVHRGARTIGIVDGYFNSTRAIWHKEILWALDQGVAVFGAASMGALRAAELAVFGMRGVGWVFDAFVSGRLEDDDEVAIIHAPAELGFCPLSEAMVNVRRTLERSVAEGTLAPRLAQAVEAAAKELFYADREWPLILRKAAPAIATTELEVFERWLPAGRVDVKREDALALAQALAEAETCAVAVPSERRFEATTLVESARLLARQEDGVVSQSSSMSALLLDEVRHVDPDWRNAEEDHAFMEALALARAVARGLPLDERELLRAVAAFRQANDLETEVDVSHWLEARNLTESRLLSILARDVRLRQAKDDLAPLTSEILRDRAWLRSDAPALLARAIGKRRSLVADPPHLTD